MDAYKKWQERKHAAERAAAFVQLLDTKQPHLDGKTGALHKIQIATTIHHQAYPGATNYHTLDVFDAHLAFVVGERFKELAAEAIKNMREDVEDARKAARSEYAALEGTSELTTT